MQLLFYAISYLSILITPFMSRRVFVFSSEVFLVLFMTAWRYRAHFCDLPSAFIAHILVKKVGPR